MKEDNPESSSSKSLRSLYEDDPSLAPLIQAFKARLPMRLADIRSAIEGSETDEARRLCHQLKGAAGSYGFPPISEALEQLEQTLGQADKSQTEQLLKDVETLAKRLEVAP